MRRKRSIGIVEQPDWDRWQIAAMASEEMALSEFISLHVNRATDEVLGRLSPQKLNAIKKKVARSKRPKPTPKPTT